MMHRNTLDVLCIGTAVTDILAKSIPDLEFWKDKQRIEQIQLAAGGDALNQSVRLADQGYKVGLIAGIGKDNNASFLRSYLKERMVNIDYMREKDLSTGTSLVLIAEDGKRNTFSVKGAHSELTKEDMLSIETLKKLKVKVVSLASIFSMPHWEKDGLREYLKELKDASIITIADLGSDKLHQGLDGIRDFLPFIDYFLPSDQDALDMTHAETIEEAAEVYSECGAKNIVIKCGEKGAYYLSDTVSEENEEKQSGWVSAYKVNPIDTTGAGDCMVAYFIGNIVKGVSLEASVFNACRMASLSTTYFGASTKMISAVSPGND